MTTDGGISPVSLFLCRSSTERLGSAPREEGRRPLMLEDPRKLEGQRMDDGRKKQGGKGVVMLDAERKLEGQRMDDGKQRKADVLDALRKMDGARNR